MKRYEMETAVGIFIFIGLLCVAYLTFHLGRIPFGSDTYLLNAKFTTISGLRVGSAVNMFGMEIGRVSRFDLDQENQQANVEMKIRNGIKIYEDAMASIKTEGLIGDKYISIDPGGGAGDPLTPGGTIVQTQPAIDVGDIIGKYAFGDVKKEEPSKK